jgi:hypothetical protein
MISYSVGWMGTNWKIGKRGMDKVDRMRISMKQATRVLNNIAYTTMYIGNNTNIQTVNVLLLNRHGNGKNDK